MKIRLEPGREAINFVHNIPTCRKRILNLPKCKGHSCFRQSFWLNPVIFVSAHWLLFTDSVSGAEVIFEGDKKMLCWMNWKRKETINFGLLLLQRRFLLWKITKNREGFGVQNTVSVNIPSYAMRSPVV
jgi:hypothetical protein